MKRRTAVSRKCRPAAALPVLLGIFLLNACAAGHKPVESTAPSQPPTSAENPASVPGGDSQTTAASETTPDIAAGYQFVTGYGIIAPGSPRVYQKDPSFRPVVKEDDASGELLYAVYQDGAFRYRYKVKDTSIELIPENEVKELLEKEKENQRLQEAGMEAGIDIRYFAIDEEKGIYGRSGYENRTDMQKQDGSAQIGPFTSYITGEELPEGGYSQRQGKLSRNYGEFLEMGYVNTYGEYMIESYQPEGWAPTKYFQLHFMGFSEPVEFTFSPAPEYASLDEIPGITKIGDYRMLAQAEIQDGEIMMTTYAWPKEGYKLTSLLDQKLEYRTEGGTGVCVSRQRNYSMPVSGTLKGLAAGTQGTISLYDLPEAAEDASFTLTAPMMLVSSQESPEKTTIPIPQQNQKLSLDRQIRLKDCTIRLTGVRRAEEDLLYGRNGNEDIMKPALYVDFEVETNDARMEIDWFQAQRKTEGEGEALTLYPKYEDNQVPLAQQKIKELLVLYNEGSDEVSFSIDLVTYRLIQDVRVPVLMEE